MNERLLPVPAADAGRMARLLADLDSDRFAVRQKASQAILKVGDEAEEALRTFLAGRVSAEARRRAEGLLEQLDATRSSEHLRRLRALEVLEHLGTPPARQVLERLTTGAPRARLTREAQASLERLFRRPHIVP